MKLVGGLAVISYYHLLNSMKNIVLMSNTDNIPYNNEVTAKTTVAALKDFSYSSLGLLRSSGLG